MKPITKHPGLILLLLLLIAACSIPASAAPYSGDIPDTPFRWTLNDTEKSLDIFPVFPVTGSLDLTPDVISKIGFTESLQPKDIRKLTLSNAITGIKADTFKDFTGLSNLYFQNGNAAVAPTAFPAGKVYQVKTTSDITNIYTAWAVPGEEVGVTYSAVIPEEATTQVLLKIDSRNPVSIYVDTTASHPVYLFLMPKNIVSLSLITEDRAGPQSAGTSVTFMTCRVNITADPDITFSVSARKYNESTGELELVPVPVINGTASVTLIGDEKVFVTVITYPAGNTLSAVTRGVDRTLWTGTTYSIESYNEEADNGDVRVHIVSIPPHHSDGGGSSTILPSTEPVIPPISQEIPGIEGILIEGGDNKVSVEDISEMYPGLYDAADVAINLNTALPAAISGIDSLREYLFTENPSLDRESVDEITAILMNAMSKGILHKIINTEDYIIIVSNGEKIVEFYRTYDITPESADVALREVYFKVPLEDLRTAGFTDKDVIMYHGYPDDKIWIPLDTWLIGTDGTSANYVAYTNGASPFAIVFTKDASLYFPWHLIIAAAAGFVIILGGYITCRIIRKQKEKENRKKAEDELGGST